MLPRLRRRDSFVGIHFDFHAQDDPDTPVGRNTNPEAIRYILEKSHPDYIQFDCKGHPGLSSYPTEVGYPAPNIVGDPLRTVRDVTAELGVALYVHYSGLWDTYAIKQRPEWARIRADGSADPDITSIFSSYADELMIPQLLELSQVYGVDGAWIDGDAWCATLDYSEAALEAFARATGVTTVPREPGDPHYRQFREFSRDTYRNFVRSYVDRIHAVNPDFQIAVNWAFTEFMPEPVSANVDFLSGDAAGLRGILARNEARPIVRQGLPWDVMAWSFSGSWPDPGTNTTRSVRQLSQVAATIISLGGGFQTVFNQKRDGTVIRWHMDIMEQLAAFVRARQHWCQGSELIPQIALLYSGHDCYAQSTNERLNQQGPFLANQHGMLDALLEAQQVVEITMEHQLRERMAEYPLVVIPGWYSLADGLREELLEYVHNGGSVLAIGPGPTKMFEQELGVTVKGDVVDAPFFVKADGRLTGFRAVRQPVELLDGTTLAGQAFFENDDVGASEPAASIRAYGAGKIGAIFFDFGTYYGESASAVARKFLMSIVKELAPTLGVQISGTSFVDVVFARNHDATLVHLINIAGQQKDLQVSVFDDIPPVGPIDVRVSLAQAPTTVTCEPEGLSLDFSYADGAVSFTVPSVEIHTMVVLA